ncbi:MAG: hypothetical protein Kow00121_58940 [Elainellaceae cyanobacterium]
MNLISIDLQLCTPKASITGEIMYSILNNYLLLADITQFVDEAFAGMVLVITSIVGLLGGSFAGWGMTLNLKTPQGLVNFFLMAVGACGLLIVVADVLNPNG